VRQRDFQVKGREIEKRESDEEIEREDGIKFSCYL
jgi:hypothetical protein